MSIELNKNLLKPIKNAKPNDLNSDQNSQRIPMQLFQHDKILLCLLSQIQILYGVTSIMDRPLDQGNLPLL